MKALSKYTTEVRFICETEAGLDESVGYNSIDDILRSAAPNIFNFEYPIFDEDYRLALEIKILRHYYTREISEETIGLWKLRLQAKMNEIMPYYNKMYKSELLEFNPLYDIDTTRSYVKKDDGQTDSENSANSKNWNVYSDTPQGSLQNVENETYLTNASKNTSEDENTGKIVIDNTEKYLEKVQGKQSSTSFSKLLKEYRDSFLNIDMDVINELSSLFFGLW